MSDGLLIQLLQKNARYKVSDLVTALAESKDSIVERLNRLEKREDYLWLPYYCQLGTRQILNL